jgi:hypothetical protein
MSYDFTYPGAPVSNYAPCNKTLLTSLHNYHACKEFGEDVNFISIPLQWFAMHKRTTNVSYMYMVYQLEGYIISHSVVFRPH